MLPREVIARGRYPFGTARAWREILAHPRWPPGRSLATGHAAHGRTCARDDCRQGGSARRQTGAWPSTWKARPSPRSPTSRRAVHRRARDRRYRAATASPRRSRARVGPDKCGSGGCPGLLRSPAANRAAPAAGPALPGGDAFARDRRRVSASWRPHRGVAAGSSECVRALVIGRHGLRRRRRRPGAARRRLAGPGAGAAGIGLAATSRVCRSRSPSAI